MNLVSTSHDSNLSIAKAMFDSVPFPPLFSPFSLARASGSLILRLSTTIALCIARDRPFFGLGLFIIMGSSAHIERAFYAGSSSSSSSSRRAEVLLSVALENDKSLPRQARASEKKIKKKNPRSSLFHRQARAQGQRKRETQQKKAQRKAQEQQDCEGIKLIGID